MPSLKDGDKTINESVEIVKYVDGLGDGPLGADKVDRGLVTDWVDTIGEEC